MVTAVLEALAAPAGAEDARTREQRYHDALDDAMRRLVVSGLLPDRAEPVKYGRTCPWPSCGPWTTDRRCRPSGSARWPSGGRPPRGRLPDRQRRRRLVDGKAASAIAATPRSSRWSPAAVDPAALDGLVALCLQSTGHGPHCEPAARPGQEMTVPTRATTASARAARGPPRRKPWRCSATRSSARPSTLFPARAAWPASCAPGARRPPGWAQPAAGCRALRRHPRRDPPRGYPARPALRWAGGCDQPASACEVHHVTHLADGGTTSVDRCAAVLLLP